MLLLISRLGICLSRFRINLLSDVLDEFLDRTDLAQVDSEHYSLLGRIVETNREAESARQLGPLSHLLMH